MAKDERISLRGIDREIRAVASKLKAARRRVDASRYAHLDRLAKQLKDLQKSVLSICIQIYGVWPEPGPAARGKAARSRKRGARRARTKKAR